jgi:transposase
MLNVANGTRIYLAAGATDMRRGFNGLQGQVTQVLNQDPLSGHLFLFVNRRRDKLKKL